MKTIHLFIATVLLSSFVLIQKDEFKKTAWLQGTWEMKTSRGSIYETWRMENENQLQGMSYMVNVGDTAVFERVRLVLENNEIYYIPAVRNQNDGQEIRFKAASITNNQMVFENPEHDYPQKIQYSMITPDSLVAEISGDVNGVIKRQVFPMKKR